MRRLNAYPPYAGAKIEVTHLADDASEIRVRMTLEESNSNLVGTHFGGSLYAMVDPHLMILLMRRLGPGYVVWDQSAAIDFVKPGRGTVHATVRIAEVEISNIREATKGGEKHFPAWELEVRDEDGEVVARVSKTLYVRKRRGPALAHPSSRTTEPWRTETPSRNSFNAPWRLRQAKDRSKPAV
jgi:acyl-coenzyme A thioesterase PaaI-like protein